MQNRNSHTDLFIGVDGGQSSTLTVLATADGVILASAATGPCNHIDEPGGLERQYNALRHGLEQVFFNAQLPPTRLRSVYLGLTGSGHQETVKSVYTTETLTIASDLVIALSGAITDMCGVIVIAGTGSAAYGQNGTGQTGVSGGHGYYAGDEGSAADIARMAFRAIFQAADGRGPSTTLTVRLLDYYGCLSLKELRRRIYGDLTRDQLAKAAQVVGQAAVEDEDVVAISLLNHAGYELGRLVAAVLRQLDWLRDPVPVVPIGGVFRSGSLVIDTMTAFVHTVNTAAYVGSARFQPVIGALLLSYRAVGLPITEAVVRNLDRTFAYLLPKY